MGSPSGEKMLGGWNDRTDLHLSLQLTLTTPIAYRNDQWCRVVWGSQQVHSAFFFPFPLQSPPSPPHPSFLLLFLFFLWHDMKHREITLIHAPSVTPCPSKTNITADPVEPLLSTSLAAWDAQSPQPPHYSLLRFIAGLLQFLAVPSQPRRQRGDNPPDVPSSPSHPTLMTEAVQMPLESGQTQLPSSSVVRTKAAFPISHPKGLLPPPSAC